MSPTVRNSPSGSTDELGLNIDAAVSHSLQDPMEPSMYDDRNELIGQVLTMQENSFRPLKTVPLFSVHLLISTIISVIGIVFALAWKDSRRCDAYFIMIYLRCVFWVITFVFDHIVKHHHNTLRLNGYHDFHKETSVHKGVPLYVVSLWNTTIMVVQTLIQQELGDSFEIACLEAFLSPITYITAIHVLENLVLCAVNGVYIDKVRQFNRSAQAPDALGDPQAGGSIGVSMSNGDVYELLEKQAVLIEFYKDHNLRLSQRLMLRN